MKNDICLNDAREYVIAVISYDIVNDSFRVISCSCRQGYYWTCTML